MIVYLCQERELRFFYFLFLRIGFNGFHVEPYKTGVLYQRAFPVEPLQESKKLLTIHRTLEEYIFYSRQHFFRLLSCLFWSGRYYAITLRLMLWNAHEMSQFLLCYNLRYSTYKHYISR